MKIQKGIVKYKDRDDIVCTYGITDDGNTYYFLNSDDEKMENKQLANGNWIASTELVEAIDRMIKPSKIGLISENGDVVIPFENRSIKLVNDDILLVEKATPTSQNVIDANNLRSDSKSATKLVSTAAAIRDKLYAVENTGRFIFNDLFSEATVCDINGNNLVDGQYFSFIYYSPSHNKLYFSTNEANSEISQYSLLPPQVQSDITPNSDSSEIDVNDIEVPTSVVEDALSNAQVQEPDLTSEDNMVQPIAPVEGSELADEPVVDNADENKDEAMDNVVVPEQVDDNINPDDKKLVDEDDVEIEEEAVQGQEDVAPLTPTVATDDSATLDDIEIPVVNEEVSEDTKDETAEEVVEEVQNADEPVEEVKEDTDIPVEEEHVDTVDEAENAQIPEEINEETPEEVSDNNEFDEIVGDLKIDDNDLKTYDDLINSDDFDVDFYEDTNKDDTVDTKDDLFENEMESSDNVVAELTKSLREMIDKNREQSKNIATLRQKLSTASAQRKLYSDKYQEQLTKSELLTSKLSNAQTVASRYQAKSQNLSRRVAELERALSNREKDISYLKGQLSGNPDVAKALADAKALINGDVDSYSSNEDNFTKKIA